MKTEWWRKIKLRICTGQMTYFDNLWWIVMKIAVVCTVMLQIILCIDMVLDFIKKNNGIDVLCKRLQYLFNLSLSYFYCCILLGQSLWTKLLINDKLQIWEIFFIHQFSRHLWFWNSRPFPGPMLLMLNKNRLCYSIRNNVIEHPMSVIFYDVLFLCMSSDTNKWTNGSNIFVPIGQTPWVWECIIRDWDTDIYF